MKIKFNSNKNFNSNNTNTNANPNTNINSDSASNINNKSNIKISINNINSNTINNNNTTINNNINNSNIESNNSNSNISKNNNYNFSNNDNNTFKIVVYPQGKIIKVKKEYNLRLALIENGIDIESSCGGAGTCGRCKVKIISGSVLSQESKFIRQEQKKENIYLSCLSYVNSNLEILVFPTEKKKAKIEGDEFNLKKDKYTPYTKAFYAKEILDKLIKNNLNSWIIKEKIKVEKPTLFYNTSDVFRLKKSIYDNLKIKDIKIPLKILQKLPNILRSSDWEIFVTVDKISNNLINIQDSNSSKDIFGFAVDIGTTTIVIYLVNLKSGEILISNSDYNPQIKYGEDIINRIVFSLKNQGLEILQKAVVEKINKLSIELLEKLKISFEDVAAFIVSGNSTMTHLFFGVSPKFIREEPYITVSNSFEAVKAKEVGLENFNNAYIYCIEGVASYLGGDITSGLVSINILQRKNTCLFIDLGTNGEMVIGNKDWLIGCSCSAGPAFEGGGVDWGVRAVEGAIEKVDIDKVTFKCSFETIGNQKPLGICGSGLIDLLGEMYLKGVIDRKGKFNKDIGNIFLKKVNDEYRYVIADKTQSASGSEIYVNEVDINNLIRAKAAVYSGIKTLLEEVDLKIKDIDKIYIAGGLGKNLNVRNAVVIGMLPDVDLRKYFFLGNTSIIGAYFSLISIKKYKLTKKIASKITYAELSVNTKFMDRYIAGLFLPYTDIKDFPTVEKLIYNL